MTISVTLSSRLLILFSPCSDLLLIYVKTFFISVILLLFQLLYTIVNLKLIFSYFIIYIFYLYIYIFIYSINLYSINLYLCGSLRVSVQRVKKINDMHMLGNNCLQVNHVSLHLLSKAFYYELSLQYFLYDKHPGKIKILSFICHAVK